MGNDLFYYISNLIFPSLAVPPFFSDGFPRYHSPSTRIKRSTNHAHRLEFIKRRPSLSGHRRQDQDLISLLKLCFHFIEESYVLPVNH